MWSLSVVPRAILRQQIDFETEYPGKTREIDHLI